MEVQRKYRRFIPFNEAAGISEGKVKLCLHTSHQLNPVKFSTGSCLMGSKPNVGTEFIDCKAINFAEFLSKFPRNRRLKIDIEDFKVELIPHLINLHSLKNVDYVFVEIHEKKWPELVDATAAMKKSVAESPYNDQIRWDWP